MTKRRMFNKKLWVRVNKRDNGTCQNPLCFKSKKTQQHHLFDWSSYPALRFKSSNLITLCSTRSHFFGLFKVRGCHQKYHKWMGGFTVPTTPNSLYRWFVVNGFRKISMALLVGFLGFLGFMVL